MSLFSERMLFLMEPRPFFPMVEEVHPAIRVTIALYWYSQSDSEQFRIQPLKAGCGVRQEQCKRRRHKRERERERDKEEREMGSQSVPRLERPN